MKTNWTAQDIPSLKGKTAVVTGANSGVGFYTALELGRAGADVVVASRDIGRGEAALESLREQAPGARFHLEQLDLASLASVRSFAQRLSTSRRAIDILVNNAGLMALPERQTTADGFEMQFGTNYLGHFALTGLLLPLLRESPAPRVVALSSGVALWGKVDLDDLQSERSYAPMGTYGQSKLANLIFAIELDRRARSLGITSVAAHPGASITNLQRHTNTGLVGRIGMLIMHVIGLPPARSALPSLYAATGEDVKGGSYFSPGASLFGLGGAPGSATIPKRALDPAIARGLWEASEKLTGVVYSRKPTSVSARAVEARA